MNKRNILLLILAFLILGFGIGYYLWKKEPENQSTGKADFEKDLTTWVKQLDSDTGSTRTFSQFVGKSVQFSGEVSDVMGDSSLTLQLKTGVEGFYVNANFHQDFKATVGAVVAGDVVTLQCVCDGLTVPASADDLFSEKKIDMSRCNLIKLEQNKADVSQSLDHSVDENIDSIPSKTDNK